MPSSPHERGRPDRDDLRHFLASTVPDVRLTEEIASANCQPVVLMETPRLMAAFGLTNENPKGSYETLYGWFKNQYGERRSKWDELDLAFVLCMEPNVQEFQWLSSTIETDTYFCRKFVVPFEFPLDRACARLPFLPLAPVEGQSLRPPSAQTFLRQCGMPATLARYIVAPGERGAARIAEDCVSGTFGDPSNLERGAVSHPALVGEQAITSSARLDGVTITSFRAYRKAQDFDLGSDVTVLYGPNGFGKTSFFDAVDFAATGDIGRMRLSEARFKKVAAHLDGEPRDAVVSLRVNVDGVKHTVTRRVSDRRSARFDGRTHDRKEILARLTGRVNPTKERVENLVSLFRATHLFSQEHQELAKDFVQDSELSPQIVSRLLAFEDYVSAVRKASGVRDVARGELESTRQEIDELRNAIATDRREVKRLGRWVTETAKPRELERTAAGLREELKHAAVEISDDAAVDQSTIRGWRVMLEARLTELRNTRDRLSSLTDRVASLRRFDDQVSELENERKTHEKERASISKRLKDEKARLLLINSRLETLRKQTTDAEIHREALMWLIAQQREFIALSRDEDRASEAIDKAKDALITARREAKSATDKERSVGRELRRIKDALVVLRSRLKLLRELEEVRQAWQENRASLKANLQQDLELNQGIRALEGEQRHAELEKQEVLKQQVSLESSVTQADRTQSELKQLLSQLQGHVKTGTCPLCGVDHGSVESLVERIESRMVVDGASGLRARLRDVRRRYEEADERLKRVTEALEGSRSRLLEIRAKRKSLEADIAVFTNAAVEAQLVVGDDSTDVAKEVERRIGRITEEIGDAERREEILGEESRLAQESAASASKLQSSCTEEVEAKQSSLDSARSRLKELRTDSRWRQQIEADWDAGKREVSQVKKELVDLDGKRSEAERDLAQCQSAVDGFIKDIEAREAERSTVRSRISEIGAAKASVIGQFEELKLSAETSKRELMARVADLVRDEESCVTLLGRVTALEAGMDAATSTAMASQLRQGIVVKLRDVERLKKKQDAYAPWLRYFEGTTHLLETEQSSGVIAFAEEYGPRTSIIQRRLRSVYGFDDIDISSKESRIVVSVKRRGEQLRPIDYFSQSQQQTLLLGLFLTAALSQSWSSLSPIFLDDPVTHFDDLNTYAFLDLIAGLCVSEQRQFVVSTCDAKLFRLARQKFKNLGDGAKYYEFSAIGSEGPVVAAK